MAFGHNDICLLGLLGKINKKDGIFAYSYSFCVNFGIVKAAEVLLVVRSVLVRS